ncbi:MAG: hypothetical protein AB1627_05095 [Chloroflexota bacterium]
MTRRLAASLLLGAAVLGCSAGAAPTYAPFESPSAGPGAAGTSAPTPEPVEVPVEATWADIRGQPEDALVAITGRVTAGFMVSCFDVGCGLNLYDPADESGDAESLTVHVIAVAEAGTPNTMVRLPKSFTEDDLELTTDDGTTIRSGDNVRIVGRVGRDGDSVWLDCVRLEAAPEPEPTAPPVADVVTFKQLRKLPEGTLVRIRGTLSIPWFTFCTDRRCRISLDDPASARTTDLLVAVIRGDDPRYNGMLPLPKDFGKKDLKVFTDTGKRVGYGARVWVVGTLDNAPSEDVRDIEVSAITAVR